MLHPLVVLEIADRAGCAERSSRNLAREASVRAARLAALARIGGVPRPGIRFHGEVCNESILPEPCLPRAWNNRRSENRPRRRARGVLRLAKVLPRGTEDGRRCCVSARRGKRARQSLAGRGSERYRDGRNGGQRRRTCCQNRYRSERYVGALPASAERPVSCLLYTSP